MRTPFDISKIDDDDLPPPGDFHDWEEGDYPESDDEYWVKGQLREDCNFCGGIGCIFCNDLGYNVKKR